MTSLRPAELAEGYAATRRRTVALCAPLSAEDQVAQAMPDASPVKWHLAHTTWFFETFVLGRTGARAFDPAFGYLFNSYYEAAGPRVARARRGLLTRPSLERVHAYRAAIDEHVLAALAAGALDADARAILELGLHHEQQHQELILTDLKLLLGTSPLRPAYRLDLRRPPAPRAAPPPLGWRAFDGGVHELGARAEPIGADRSEARTAASSRRATPEGGARAGAFAFDNERPRHRAIVAPFRLATRPIANAEVLAFLAAGGYREPRLWLSDGWQHARAEGWEAPLYWERLDGAYGSYDLTGVHPIDPAATAGHLSMFEADAIARWLGGRLPTEAEWEVAAAGEPPTHGNFADDDRLAPGAALGGGALEQLFGDVWEWTASSYAAYPRYRPLPGALGEYNGKFMCGQYVLRGGSCFTPRGHVRATYRNFFPPGARWQMAGARLATDA